MDKEVKEFINHFLKASPTQNVTEVFTCGCCYYFAFIITSRFHNGEIMYDQLENHFVAKINDRLYDITGDVTDKYNVIRWKDFDDTTEKQRIKECCIDFIR